MKDFLAKFDEIFTALNTSSLWEAIKSIVSKLKKLLGVLGEDEAVDIISEVVPEAE